MGLTDVTYQGSPNFPKRFQRLNCIIDTETENYKNLNATTSSNDSNNYVQTVVSSTVTYIENCLKSKKCNDFRKLRCKQTLQKVSSVCTHVETLRKINEISLDTSIQLSSCWNVIASTIKDLSWERVEQLTSPTTSYDAIKYFTENAGTGIHPCVVLEIILKWWRVRTDREHVDMSFITPLITTIQNVSTNWWYYSVCQDKRYKGLTEKLPAPRTPARYDSICNSHSNRNTNLKDCISEGDGTPAQLKDLICTDNMKRYRDSVPAFTYNSAVFPPYGDTKHHWFIKTYYQDHVSLIADSREEILDYFDHAPGFYLYFVPLPDTPQ